MMNKLNKYFVLLPIIYLFVAIFIARSDVKYVYAATIVLVVLALFIQRNIKLKPEILLARWLTILGAIGLTAAAILSIEKIELLSDPGRIASCSLSPVVACSPVISSPQASVFGFANSFFGLFGFCAVFVAGITILAGATKLHKLWWRTLLAGTAAGTIFSMWLIHEGVFEIGKLCLYCMLVWLVSFALFFLVTAHAVQNKYVNFGSKINKLLSYKYELIATAYAVIFLILFFRWADYWLSLF